MRAQRLLPNPAHTASSNVLGRRAFGQNLHRASARSGRLSLTTTAAITFPDLSQLFKPKKRRGPTDEARDKILEIVTSGSIDTQRLSEIVGVLVDTPSPFKEQQIGGGPWIVVYTQGPLVWQTLTAPCKLFNPNNQFSQEFDSRARTLVNRGQLLGERIRISASGVYAPQGDTSSTPVTIKATVQSGSLQLFGLTVPLPIKGSGEVLLAYLDDTIRVFQTPQTGALSLQVRADVLGL